MENPPLKDNLILTQRTLSMSKCPLADAHLRVPIGEKKRVLTIQRVEVAEHHNHTKTLMESRVMNHLEPGLEDIADGQEFPISAKIIARYHWTPEHFYRR